MTTNPNETFLILKYGSIQDLYIDWIRHSIIPSEGDIAALADIMKVTPVELVEIYKTRKERWDAR